MSTRGCVAIRQEGDGRGYNDYGLSWRGVYNHSDSYPTGLGPDVWRVFTSFDPVQTGQAMLQMTDWREFLNGGVCEYCGKRGLGQPHSIRGDVALAEKVEGRYPDSEAKGHSHTLDDGARVEDRQLTSESPGPLHIEYVYLIDPLNRTLTILTSNFLDSDGHEIKPDGPSLIDYDSKQAWDYGHCVCNHIVVERDIPLDGPEPDWAAIEAKAREEEDG